VIDLLRTVFGQTSWGHTGWQTHEDGFFEVSVILVFEVLLSTRLGLVLSLLLLETPFEMGYRFFLM
jgi:hypothetical protein